MLRKLSRFIYPRREDYYQRFLLRKFFVSVIILATVSAMILAVAGFIGLYIARH